MEPLKHECGVAMIRLLKPLEYYQENTSASKNTAAGNDFKEAAFFESQIPPLVFFVVLL